MTADLSIIVNGIEVLATLGVVWSLIRSQRILFAASPKPQVPQQDTGTKAKKTPTAGELAGNSRRWGCDRPPHHPRRE